MIAGLKSCKSECKKPLEDVKQFLDNICFLSENKMNMCKESCAKKDNPDEYDNCNWVCYNKLDRRYRDYWLKQRNEIIDRHFQSGFQFTQEPAK